MTIQKAIKALNRGKKITRSTAEWAKLYLHIDNNNETSDGGIKITDSTGNTYNWIPMPADISANDWIVYNEQTQPHRLGGTEFESLCKTEIARDLRKIHADKDYFFLSDDVYTVWLCKALQNNKGLFATSCPDGLYYECTFSGDKGELYIDRYCKQENICIKLGEDNDAEYYSSGTVDTSVDADSSDSE